MKIFKNSRVEFLIAGLMAFAIIAHNNAVHAQEPSKAAIANAVPTPTDAKPAASDALRAKMAILQKKQAQDYAQMQGLQNQYTAMQQDMLGLNKQVEDVRQQIVAGVDLSKWSWNMDTLEWDPVKRRSFEMELEHGHPRMGSGETPAPPGQQPTSVPAATPAPAPAKK